MPNYEEEFAVTVVVSCNRCATKLARPYAMYEGDWQDYPATFSWCKGRFPCSSCRAAAHRAQELGRGWIMTPTPDVNL